LPWKPQEVPLRELQQQELDCQGGFGNVYKGYIQDGIVIAVKRLKDIPLQVRSNSRL